MHVFVFIPNKVDVTLMESLDRSALKSFNIFIAGRHIVWEYCYRMSADYVLCIILSQSFSSNRQHTQSFIKLTRGVQVGTYYVRCCKQSGVSLVHVKTTF